MFEQKAWEVAQAPFKNLLMMGFMMWMAGSTVHLFSIGITFSALWQPISALQGVGRVRWDKLLVLFFYLQLLYILTSPWSINNFYGLNPWLQRKKNLRLLNLKSTNFTYFSIIYYYDALGLWRPFRALGSLKVVYLPCAIFVISLLMFVPPLYLFLSAGLEAKQTIY